MSDPLVLAVDGGNSKTYLALLFFTNRRSNVRPDETVSENPAFGTAPTREPVAA